MMGDIPRSPIRARDMTAVVATLATVFSFFFRRQFWPLPLLETSL